MALVFWNPKVCTWNKTFLQCHSSINGTTLGDFGKLLTMTKYEKIRFLLHVFQKTLWLCAQGSGPHNGSVVLYFFHAIDIFFLNAGFWLHSLHSTIFQQIHTTKHTNQNTGFALNTFFL